MIADALCTAAATLARSRGRFSSKPENPEYAMSGQNCTSGSDALTQPEEASGTSATRAAIATLGNTSRYRVHRARPYAGGPQIMPSGVRSNFASDVSRTRIRSAPDRDRYVTHDTQAEDEQNAQATLQRDGHERVPHGDQQRHV